MTKEKAEKSATELLRHILQSQPGLISTRVPSAGTGGAVGEFIIALHKKLIAMFESLGD